MLAVQEWLTPEKRSFWHRGIEPDVKVAMPLETAPLRPLAEREMSAAQLQSSGDAQLLKAIKALSDEIAKSEATSAER
jgi:C-terminal processing protease CtpA/Prc